MNGPRYPWVDIDPPTHRVHPAYGALRLSPGATLATAGSVPVPLEWQGLPDDVEEAARTRWYRGLLTVLASRGTATIEIDLSDPREMEHLLAVQGCEGGGRPLSARCVLTTDSIDAVLKTNPSILVVLVDDRAALSVWDSWDDAFLHVEDDELVSAISCELT